MKAKKKKILFTLDINSKVIKNYYSLNKLMNELGFKKYSPNKGIDLPNNTYFGVFKEHDLDIKNFKNELWNLLIQENIPVKRIFGAVLEDWSLRSKKSKSK